MYFWGEYESWELLFNGEENFEKTAWFNTSVQNGKVTAAVWVSTEAQALINVVRCNHVRTIGALQHHTTAICMQRCILSAHAALTF